MANEAGRLRNGAPRLASYCVLATIGDRSDKGGVPKVVFQKEKRNYFRGFIYGYFPFGAKLNREALG